jgi:cytochrome c-type biogenesis protein CcmE
MEIKNKTYTHKEYLEDFEKITKRMYDVTKAKNADYTGDLSDPFKNFKQVEFMGICSAEQGFLTRMTDKMMRIGSFVKKGELQVKDESVTDTLQDLAIYAILMLCYIKSKKD